MIDKSNSMSFKKLIYSFAFLVSAFMAQSQSLGFYGVFPHTNYGLSQTSVFKTDLNCNNLTEFDTLHSFPGAMPLKSKLMEHPNGKLYGTASGSNTIFEYEPLQDKYKVLYQISNSALGSNPETELTLGADGKLYGLTKNGGANNFGVIFSFDLITNTYSKLFDFDGTNGKNISGKLLAASDGKLYGVSEFGGSSGKGVFFSFDPVTLIFTKIIDFTGANGDGPSLGVVQASNGCIYGFTYSGGANNIGTVFRYILAFATFSTVYSFDATNFNPVGMPVVGATNLYGITNEGGANSKGTIFEFSLSSNSILTKYNFTSSIYYGYQPYPYLTYKNNRIYGNTNFGGANNGGILYRFDVVTNIMLNLHDFDVDALSGSYTTLNTGTSCVNGVLYCNQNGKLYGMTLNGGNGKSNVFTGCGVLFSYDLLNSIYTRQVDFGLIGGNVKTRLSKMSDGSIFGDTYDGGIEGAGTIFSYSNQDSTLTEEYSLSAALQGEMIADQLIEGDNLMMYGSTMLGGANNLGTIFKFNKQNNTLTKLYDFNTSLGNQSASSFVFHDSTLFGVCSDGGLNSNGVFFSFDLLTNSYTPIYHFDATQYPKSSLISIGDSIILGITNTGNLYQYNILSTQFQILTALGSNGDVEMVYNKYDSKLYVVCLFGGTNSAGFIQSYDLQSQTQQVLYNFLNASPTKYPRGKPLIASNRKLYGYASYNGASWDLYEYDISQNILNLKHQVQSGLVFGNSKIGLIEECVPSYGIITATACDTFVAPNNKSYSQSGTYTLFLTNSIGCDSIVTLNLLIKNATYLSVVESDCESYTAPDNQIYTQSGTYTAILTNAQGCDSIITIDLTIKNPSSSNITESVCNSYTAPDNQVYTQSGIYSAILTNIQGCDSIITIDLTIKNPTSSSISESVCNSYTAPDNQVYTQSGTYTAIIQNTQGCDSTITIDLIIKTPTSSTISDSICQSYTAPDNQVYTQSGTYTATIPNSQGCDSTITIDLTIKTPSSSTIFESICQSYTAPDNQVYIASGTYTAIIPNAQGCDSIITIDLTIKNPTSSSITESVCNSYTAPDNQIYTQSGTYTAVISNSQGCDSTITIDLTINNPSSSSISESVCNSYTAPDNQIYTQSGTYTAIIPNNQGCDSTITIDLTVENLESTINFDNGILSSEINDGTYQWVDCLNNDEAIVGITSQTFTVETNGEYAVIVTKNNCSDTSECILVSSVGLKSLSKQNITLNPNPSSNYLYISFGEPKQAVSFKVYSLSGQLIEENTFINKENFEIDTRNYSDGMYFVELEFTGAKEIFKFVKE